MSQFTEDLKDAEDRLMDACDHIVNLCATNTEVSWSPEVLRELRRGVEASLTGVRSLLEAYGDHPWSL